MCEINKLIIFRALVALNLPDLHVKVAHILHSPSNLKDLLLLQHVALLSAYRLMHADFISFHGQKKKKKKKGAPMQSELSTFGAGALVITDTVRCASSLCCIPFKHH